MSNQLHQHGYVNKTRPCVSVFLRSAGIPATALGSVSGASYNTAVEKWLQTNWTTNWYVINTLGEELTATGNRFFRVACSSKAYLGAANAVGKFAVANRDAIVHLYSTLGAGAQMGNHPAISKAFNSMSYPERKAIMRANLARLEEVPQDEPPANG